MLKYVDVKETFSEVPDEISLCISLSNCPIHCKDCHSKYLWEDVGEEFNPVVLSSILAKHQGITCVCIFGGENDIASLVDVFKWIKNNTKLKLCWYTGLESIPKHNNQRITYYCDYVKYGPYREDCGPLTSKTTNQVFLKRVNKTLWEDITYKFNESKN